MKRNIYRIELFQSDTLINELVILAAISNGGRYIPLNDIEAVVKTNCQRYPTISKDITVNRINDHLLTIDKGTENLLVLTEVQILELDEKTISPDEAKQIIKELEQDNEQLN